MDGKINKSPMEVKKVFDSFRENLLHIPELSCLEYIEGCYAGFLFFSNMIGLISDEEHEEFLREFKNVILADDSKVMLVEEKYKTAKQVCEWKNCDEHDLNYFCGYFTSAGDLGVISEERADNMVHELTHIFDHRNDVVKDGCKDGAE